MNFYQTFDHSILGIILVEFEITSYGTPDSYWEPGDPPEIEIDKVTDSALGEDVTHILDAEGAYFKDLRCRMSRLELIEQLILNEVAAGEYTDMDWL